MNNLSSQIDEEVKGYESYAELYKNSTENNCPASELYEAYE